MKTIILGIGGALLITACSSTPTSVNLPVTGVERDYIVTDRNPENVPEWMKDFGKFKRENDGKGQTYFLGASGDVSDRVVGCDVASLDAKKHISQQIASLITEKIATSKSGMLLIDKDNPNDPGLRRHFEGTVGGKSMAFLSGTKEYSTFWEERNYEKGGGRKRVYSCNIVVTIDDQSLTNALRHTASQTTQVVEDPEAKKAVKEALKKVA